MFLTSVFVVFGYGVLVIIIFPLCTLWLVLPFHAGRMVNWALSCFAAGFKNKPPWSYMLLGLYLDFVYAILVPYSSWALASPRARFWLATIAFQPS